MANCECHTLWGTNSLQWKMAIEIVDFPIKNGYFPLLFVCSPEDNQMVNSSSDGTMTRPLHHSDKLGHLRQIHGDHLLLRAASTVPWYHAGCHAISGSITKGCHVKLGSFYLLMWFYHILSGTSTWFYMEHPPYGPARTIYFDDIPSELNLHRELSVAKFDYRSVHIWYTSDKTK